MSDYLSTQHPSIKENGYELCSVSAFLKKAPKEHVERFRRDCTGKGPLIIWDPESDADGFMVCGDTIARLNEVFCSYFTE